jgi:hypothetical protein
VLAEVARVDHLRLDIVEDRLEADIAGSAAREDQYLDLVGLPDGRSPKIKRRSIKSS